MISARFRMDLPPNLWVAEVSEAFPAATFRLLTAAPVEDRTVELGEVTGGAVEAISEAIRDHPDVVAYDRLHVDAERALARYESTDQRLFAFLGRPSVPPEFPVVVRDGAMEFDVTATRERFEAVGDALDASGFEYELLSVTGGMDPAGLLTDRQRECLAAALREGYYEVPRECTLADLAATLGVDKSTASETLRRGEARVLKRFLVGAG